MDNQPIKQPYVRTRFSRQQLAELQQAATDPIFFMERFMKVRHPTRGMVDFKLFDYQKELVEAYNSGSNVCCLFSRQMGKCATYTTVITKDNKKQTIGSLILSYLSIRQKIVSFLENILVRLAVN